jgi:hypothetical protein
MAKCKFKDCVTILSSFNDSKYCFLHHLAGFQIEEEKQEEKERVEKKRQLAINAAKRRESRARERIAA